MPFQIDSLQSALRRGGLPAGLAALNANVELRYTSVFQLDEGLVRCVGLHDKRGEHAAGDIAEVPLADSFCSFTLREGSFHTAHSRDDPRLDGNPHQGVVNAYFGVPLLDNRGELFGTLCHFDPGPNDLADDAFAVLQQAARLLPDYLPR